MSTLRMAVLYGGPSAEHDVSIASARNAAAALLEAGVRVFPVYWRRRGLWHLGAEIRAPQGVPVDRAVEDAIRNIESALPIPAGAAAAALAREIDGVFCLAHGEFGEDGCVQGMFRILGVPVLGTPVLGSALAMDKGRAKDLVRARTSVQVLPSVEVGRQQWRLDPTGCLARIRELGLPLVVKPVDAGSSVGLSRVDSLEEAAGALDRALDVREASAAMAERFAEGRELTSVVFGNPETGLRSLPPILIRPAHGGLFDYDAKYREGGAEELCPAPIEPELAGRLSQAASAVYEALGARGFARVDFIADPDGQLWFLELNTLPGFTDASLVPKALAAAGMPRAEFVQHLIDLAEIDPGRSRAADSDNGEEPPEFRTRAAGRG